MILGEEKHVLSTSSSQCGRALYYRVHNNMSPLDGRKPTKCSDISSENSASVWIFGNLLTNSQSRLKSDITCNFAHSGK